MKAKKGLQFPALPKDYAGLCRLQLPRPVHDRVEYANVAEVTDAMALWQDDFTTDQRDYFDLLCGLLEDYDRAHLRWPKVGGAGATETSARRIRDVGCRSVAAPGWEPEPRGHDSQG